MHKNRASIFVVDDERVIADTLAIILQQSGFAARPFYDPVEALAAAHGEPPDLLLSDVMMPRITGVELAIGVLRACPSCKVVLFSGQTETADLLSSARDRGHQFLLLAKPLHPSKLLDLIRRQILPALAEPPSDSPQGGAAQVCEQKEPSVDAVECAVDTKPAKRAEHTGVEWRSVRGRRSDTPGQEKREHVRCSYRS